MGAARRKRGFVLVFTTISSVVLVAFVGLAVDVGYLQWQRLRAQTAADSAANGGSLELRKGSNNSTITLAGTSDAALNGFTNGVSGTTVAINHPPIYGALAGNSAAVEAIVTQVVNTFFLSVIHQNQATVSARSVTILAVGAGNGCVYTLNPNASRAFQIDGGSATYFSCGLEVASSSATALHMEGSAVLYMKNHAGVGLVGGTDLTGQTKIVDFTSGSKITPAKISSLADPLSQVVAPSMSGLPVISMNHSYYDMNAKPPGNTVQPGIYCGGLQFGNTGGKTFTMAPGVYVMAGGGFNAGSQGIVSGSGVTIYNTSGPNSGVAGCNSAFAPFNIDGQANLTLNAPTSGSLEGVAIFQDRSITSASTNQFAGGSNSVINGAIYLLHSPLLFTGNTASGAYLILVADTITINGNATVSADYSTLQDGPPFPKSAVLAE